ncbi:F0F1 ATP synthase subunit B [Mangrovibrevibacter kandeliae]|uniref:F0F1 ATP synthase subunit B n=1 Tax=Mangrovibrevibacter kandeliae TaxID=2968473 RepID=UPI0021184300|nr:MULTISPECIES: F0F1 ATP synthase subunit B [unclassified Aurantimonas]MCQ8783782.1 F0F1 ATP synthase subunit B [Aurantimonas sp. CSK15Z-1]MCW4116504.1 F0F1 ATP synthase subunit B [Aurantimonas sp. MSK8Z-1]
MFVTQAFAQEADAPPTSHALPPSDTEAAQHGETVQAEGGHEGGFPPMNPQYFASQVLWLAIIFTLFYLVLKRVLVPRLAGIIENRRDRIAHDLEAAERMRLDADEAQAAYEQELAEARQRSQAIGQEARDAARADAEAERKRVEGELDAKLETAQARIAEIKQTALADVGTIAEDVAESILTDVAGLTVSREDVAGSVRAAKS